MENKGNDPIGQNEDRNANNNPENLQNQEYVDKGTRLSDYPNGNIDDDVNLNTDTIPGDQTNKPTTKSVGEATDPSKLSNL